MFCSLQVDIDVNDTPDEEEVKNDAKNQKSVKLGVLKQRQKVFEEIRALGADLEKLLQDNSGKTQLVVEVVAGKKTKLALEKNGQVVEIIEDDVVDDDEVTGEEDDVDIAASVQTVYDDDKNDEDDDDDIESEVIRGHGIRLLFPGFSIGCMGTWLDNTVACLLVTPGK